MNKVILHGHLGKNPEAKATPGGATFVRFSLATTDTWKDSEGNKKTKTEWHNCICWGTKGEVLARNVKKGQELLIEGKIEYNTKRDESTNRDIIFTTIKVENFDFCGKKESNNTDNGNTSSSAAPAENNSSYEDNDIPF